MMVADDENIIELKPRIRIGVDEMRVNDEAIAALRRDPAIYQKDGGIVRVIDDGSTVPRIQAMPQSCLRERMAAVADWQRFTDKNGWQSAPPPIWSVAAVADRGTWDGIRRINGIVTAPTMRPDGSIIDRAGYDFVTGQLFAPQATFPSVPAEPNGDEVQAAVDALLDPLCDFPFREAADRAAAVSVVCSIVARPAIEGPIPLYAARATNRGTGKSLLNDILAMAATGRVPRLIPAPPNDDAEWKKLLLGLAMEAPITVALDNVVGDLGTGPLAAVLTTEEITDRALGGNAIVTAKLRAVWMASGNNIVFKSDLARRVIAVDMESDLENPEDRAETGFRHPQLKDHVRKVWPTLAVAALTILRAYHVAGRPRHGAPRLGSFERWDELVRGALVWAGIGDPDGARARLRRESDADGEALREAMGAWEDAIGPAWKTSAEVLKRAEVRQAEGDGNLHAALSGLVRGKLSAQSLGAALRKLEKKPCGGFRICSKMNRTKQKEWSVSQITAGSQTPGAGSAGIAGSSLYPNQIENQFQKVNGVETLPAIPALPAEVEQENDYTVDPEDQF